MEAEFHFCCEIHEYCKCGTPGFCRGNDDHLYLESYMNNRSEIIEILLKIDEPARNVDYEVSHRYDFEAYESEWLFTLEVLAGRCLKNLFLWIVKNGIDPFRINENTDHALEKVLSYFRKLLKKSIDELSLEEKSIFPQAVLLNLKPADYSLLLNKALVYYSGLEYDEGESVPYIDIPWGSSITVTCSYCGNCNSCLLYNKSIRKASRSLKESGQKHSLIEAVTEIIFAEILEKNKTIEIRDLQWIKPLPENHELFFCEIENSNILDYKDVLWNYVKVLCGVVSRKSFICEEEKNTVIGKQIFLESIFSWVDSCRYLPLKEVMPEWGLFKDLHNNEKFTAEIVEELIMALAGRIFGFSIIIEEMLEQQDDPLFPLWKEMNICLQIDKFYAAQSIAVNIFGLLRDTRCVEKIKSITSNLNKENFMTALGSLVNQFGEDAIYASVLLVPFVDTKEINVYDRRTSMSRNGTIHNGMDYFSKFNMLGILLSLCFLFKEMYKYDPKDEDGWINQIFKPSNEW